MKEVGNFHSTQLPENSRFENLALLAFTLQFPNQYVSTLRAKKFNFIHFGLNGTIVHLVVDTVNQCPLFNHYLVAR